jgi:hypothetical protein
MPWHRNTKGRVLYSKVSQRNISNFMGFCIDTYKTVTSFVNEIIQKAACDIEKAQCCLAIALIIVCRSYLV